MPDLELYQPPAALARQEMNALFKLASALSDTSFAPQPFRGKPYECLAAILTGRELGIGPMESLTQIHVIQGKPTLSAQLMRALVYRQGHSISIDHSDEESCIVSGRRRDSGDTHTIAFTIEMAQKAGLVRKGGGWENYRRAMLAARATSALCRELFPDCLAGAAYVPEELGGEAAPEDVSPTQVAAIEEAPPIVLDMDPDNLEASAPREGFITSAMRAKLFATARDKGIDAHGACATALDRDIESINDLSKSEASLVIDYLVALPTP